MEKKVISKEKSKKFNCKNITRERMLIPDFSKLTLADVMCPICLSIMIEPVTMPCQHSLCLPCFQLNVAEAALACPLCRKRISIWVRKNSKANTFINMQLWLWIKENFGEKIEIRQQGKDDPEDSFVLEAPLPKVCAPGEIHEEYQFQLDQIRKEEELSRQKEANASEKTILSLQEEEKKELERIEAEKYVLYSKDLELAKQLQESEKEKSEFGSLRNSKNKLLNMSVCLSPIVGSTLKRGPMDIYISQNTKKLSNNQQLQLKHSTPNDKRSEIRIGLCDKQDIAGDCSKSPDVLILTSSTHFQSETPSKYSLVESPNHCVVKTCKYISTEAPGPSATKKSKPSASPVSLQNPMFESPTKELSISRPFSLDNSLIESPLKKCKSKDRSVSPEFPVIEPPLKKSKSSSRSLSPEYPLFEPPLLLKYNNSAESTGSPQFLNKPKVSSKSKTSCRHLKDITSSYSSESDYEIDTETEISKSKKKTKKINKENVKVIKTINKNKLYAEESDDFFGFSKNLQQDISTSRNSSQRLSASSSMGNLLLTLSTDGNDASLASRDALASVLTDGSVVDEKMMAQLIEEQKAIERNLEQVKQDRLFALRLEKDLKKIDRSKGSDDQYSLRNSLTLESNGIPSSNSTTTSPSVHSTTIPNRNSTPSTSKSKPLRNSFSSKRSRPINVPPSSKLRQTTLTESISKRQKRL